MQYSNDKKALIKSMNNLINHITSSRNAQQQIFSSLQKKDFHKIFNNLSDTIFQLRLTSVLLIGQLLCQSQNLQIKFCDIMNIHYASQSELIISSNFQQIIQNYQGKVATIFNLIKSHHKIRMSNYKKISAIIWFINPQKQNLSIQYLSQDQLYLMIKNVNKSNNPEDIIFDPLYCIFGILTDSPRHLNNISTKNTDISDIKDISAKFTQKIQPKYFQPYIPRVSKLTNYPNVANYNFPVPKLNLQSVQSAWTTPLKTQRNNSKQTSLTPQKVKDGTVKMSLAETRKKATSNYEQFSTNATSIKNSKNQNNITNFLSPKNRPVTEISKSSCLNQNYNNYKDKYTSYQSVMVNNYNLSNTQRKQQNQPKQYQTSTYVHIAPSIKVKAIAMSGRQGWQTSKNAKLQGSAHSEFVL